MARGDCVRSYLGWRLYGTGQLGKSTVRASETVLALTVSQRCIFWFNLFFIGISFTLISFCLRTPHRSLHPLKALRNVDWLGAIVFVGSLTSFLIALSWVSLVVLWLGDIYGLC